MNFSSLSTVIGLWLGVSFALWLGYRTFRQRDASKRRKLVEDAILAIEEGQTVFTAIRMRDGPESISAPHGGDWRQFEEDRLKEDVTRLLNGIESSSPFFENVNGIKKRLQQAFQLSDFLPLSEILQVRRDFWAASEVLLMEDIRSLGAELTDAQAYDSFREEAKALLFQDAALANGGDDPVSLRLHLAKEEANAYLVEVDKIIAIEREQNRLPRASEIVAGPLRLAQSARTLAREARFIVADIATTAHTLARAMSSRGLKGAAEELRKVRTDLPDQFATAFERAGGLARQGGQNLKRHYEFLLEAQELRARYAEVLAKAPYLSEKGKQFLQRLEIEKRAEQFRETSEGALAAFRRLLVTGIAYLITGLQFVQAKVTPIENKQLAVRPEEPKRAEAAGQVQPEPAQPQTQGQTPLRALLPPAGYYNAERDRLLKRGSNGGKPKSEKRSKKTSAAAETLSPEDSPRQTFGRLRDLVTGAAPITGTHAAGEGTPSQAAKRKRSAPRFSHDEGIMKTTFKDLLASAEQDQLEAELIERASNARNAEMLETSGRASLIDRLSSVEASVISSTEEGPVQTKPASNGQPVQNAPKSRRGGGFGLFRRKRP